MEDQTSGTKRIFGNRSLSTSSTESPTSKKPKDNTCEVSDLDESDEVFVELKMTEKLAQKMEQIFEKLNKLNAIEEKINKLDNIESKIENFGRKLTEIEKSVASQRCELDASKEKQVKMQRSLNELKENVSFNDERVDKLEVKSVELEQALAIAKEDLERRSLYLEAYSRRENLKFAGIPESEEPEQKQTKEVLMEFLKAKLGIEQPEDIEFQRIHRIGKVAEPAERPRMIIARFLRYTDREYVKRQAFKLKGTDFTIYDDIPKELVKERKKLMPLLHQEKKAGKKAVFSKAEPDKLYVDGKLITV